MLALQDTFVSWETLDSLVSIKYFIVLLTSRQITFLVGGG